MPTKDGDPEDGDTVEEEFTFDAKTGQMDGAQDQQKPKSGEAAQTGVDKAGEKPTEGAQAQSAQNTQQQSAPTAEGQNQNTGQQQESEQAPTSVTAQNVHNEALNLIGAYLDGDKEKAKKFFAEHPELATIANRSKKYKEAYRELVESKPAEQKPTEKQESMQQEQKTEPSETQGEDNVVDEGELTDRVYANNLERSLKAERQTQVQKFAVKEGINADHVDSLFESAEALRTANPKLPYSKCMEGAKSALQESLKKDTSVNMPSSDTDQGEGSPQKGDRESEIARLMKEHGVDKEVAERYLDGQKGQKGYDGQEGEWIAP